MKIFAWYLIAYTGGFNPTIMSWSPPMTTEAECAKVRNSFDGKFNMKCIQIETYAIK